MKKIALICVCFFISCSMFAQRTANFKQLVKQTNEYFSIYETLSPFGGACYTYRQLDVTAEEGHQLIKEQYGEDAATLNWMDDSLACADVAIQIIQSKIIANINKITSHKDFKKYNIMTLLTSDELRIVKSEDNKLYNFSFDAKNGGTYRMQVSIMHYTDYNLNQSGTISADGTENSKPDFVFADDGYNNIYTIHTTEGTKYVLTGFVQGCSSCYGSYISLISFKKNKFVEEFTYATNLRSGDGIIYDPDAKTISVNYETDDLTPDCVCGNEPDKNEEESNGVTVGDEPGGTNTGDTVDEVVLETEQEVLDEDAAEPVIRQCSCTFVFDGKSFQLKRKESLIIDTEDK